MKREEIAARLRDGSVLLAFDTNAVHGERRLSALCNRVARLNLRLQDSSRGPIRLLISTIAYAEKLFDLKQRFRDKFDLQAILDRLDAKGIELRPFAERHALETALRLGERYPDDAAWQAAKRARYIAALGLPRETAAPATGQHCGATIDWLIGGHARAEGCILVTDDNDPELGGGLERVRLDVLEAAMGEILGESG